MLLFCNPELLIVEKLLASLLGQQIFIRTLWLILNLGVRSNLLDCSACNQTVFGTSLFVPLFGAKAVILLTREMMICTNDCNLFM